MIPHHFLRYPRRNNQRNSTVEIILTLSLVCYVVGANSSATTSRQQQGIENHNNDQSLLRGVRKRKRLRLLSTHEEYREDQTHEPFFGPEIAIPNETTTKTTTEDVREETTPYGPQTRIVGGESADPALFWFYTMILDHHDDGRKFFSGCGGTIITQCHVLTAAHCVSSDRMERTDGVYVGTWQPYNSNDGRSFHLSDIDDNIDGIIQHEGYDKNTNEHDVAIIKLRNCVDPAKFPPVQLAPPGYDETLMEGDTLTVAGFGRFGQDDATRVQVLQSANVPVISRSTCTKMYKEAGRTVTSDTICAGYEAGGIDSCQGDSGGPLVKKIIENDENGKASIRILQVGIVSWGIGCARANRPGVYSSVSKHFNWIQQKVCAGDDDIIGANGLCDVPTNAPTKSPTRAPTASPTQFPTRSPTQFPTASPTQSPTTSPTQFPTTSPTQFPTTSPTPKPSTSPTPKPSPSIPDSNLEDEEFLRSPEANAATISSNNATTTNTTATSSSSYCDKTTTSTNSFTYRNQGGVIKTIQCNSIPDDESGDDLCKLSGASYTCRDACDPACRRRRRHI